MIENQLEQTDHTHLGQLITYAAGLDAVTIVWVAREFREEHRAALDWLNGVTGTEIHFFGLEVELWRIGESALAPKFNVVCQPNDWQKVAASGAKSQATGRQSLQLRFWTEFKSHLEAHSKVLTPRKPHPQNWMPFALGRSGITLCAVTSFWNNRENTWDKHEIRAELNIEGAAKIYYPQLKAQQDAIERELKQPLNWDTSGKIYRPQFRRDADLEDETQWPHYFAWLQEHLELLHRVFRPRIQSLAAPG